MNESVCIVITSGGRTADHEDPVLSCCRLLKEAGEGSCVLLSADPSAVIPDSLWNLPCLHVVRDTDIKDLYRQALAYGTDRILRIDASILSTGIIQDLLDQCGEYDVIAGTSGTHEQDRIRSFISRYYHTDIPLADLPCLCISRFVLENYLEILPDHFPLNDLLLPVLCTAGEEKICYREMDGCTPAKISDAYFRAGRDTLIRLAKRFAYATDKELRAARRQFMGPVLYAEDLVRHILIKAGFRKIRQRTDEEITEIRCRQGKARECLEYNCLRHIRRFPDLDHPATFCEKMQWLKLYNSIPEKTLLTDKYRAKQWVAEHLGDEYNVPVLGVWDRPEDIDFDALPERYVLKTNHSWHTLIVVHEGEMIPPWGKYPLNREQMVQWLDEWMQEDFAYRMCEYHYLPIRPLVFAEECLPHLKQGSEEYKLLCINGKVEFIHAFQTYEEDGAKHSFDELYTTDWVKLDWVTDRTDHKADQPLPRPDTLEEMIRIAESVSRDFPVLRMDFYDVGGKLYMGEFTFTSSSGYSDFTSLAYDLALGRKVTLPQKKYDPFRKTWSE